METISNEQQIGKKEEQSSLIQLVNKSRRIKKQHRIKIDISKTQYPLLKTVATIDLGWRVWTRQETKEEINVYWIDTYVHQQFVRRMKPYQRVNHIPGSQNLGKKNLLWNNISRMRKSVQKEYQFFPKTFNFPKEIEQFSKFSISNKNTLYIVKPCSDSQGRGIFLTKSPDTNSKEQFVVQQYIQNPILIQNTKFDLRVYVLLKSIAPLKIYIYQEGLCRLATSQYQLPSQHNLINMRMHLTNYAINKLSPNFIFNQSEYQDDKGHKRSYSATLKILEKMGCNITTLQLQIDKIIVKTIISVQNLMFKKYKQVREYKEQNQSVCFQILGFDILIKQNFEPILLEVNHSPSFCTETPLDLAIKKHLILDTLNLLNLNIQDKINYIKSRNEQDNINSSQIYKTYAKNILKEQQPEQNGSFRKIFPIDNTSNPQLARIYDNLLKIGKKEKPQKPAIIKPLTSSLINHAPFIGQTPITRLKNQIDKVIFKNTKQKDTKSFSLYHVINNLKRNKLQQLKEAIQYDSLKVPFSPLQSESNKLTEQSNSFELNPEQDMELIRKEEVIMYERKIIKDRQKQKRKYILPLPLNNVNIRLDEKFSHRNKETKVQTVKYSSPNQNPFKIHSIFNATCMTQRRKHKDKDEGKRTASNEFKPIQLVQDKFRMTDRSNRFPANNSYSIQLKQKIERMQMARLRIQKMKKVDRASFMIIKSQLPEQNSEKQHSIQ